MFALKIFIFPIALFFSIGSEGQMKKAQKLSKNYLLEGQTSSKRELSGRNSPIVLGIVLKFDRQQNEEESQAIIEYADSNGLEKTEELYYEKAWIFQWKEGDFEEKSLIEETYLICNGFLKIPSIRYCVPNHELIPADLAIYKISNKTNIKRVYL